MKPVHKSWQARYNKVLLDVCETPGPHVYVALTSVRRVLPKLRDDSILQREHGRSVGPIDKNDDKLFFSERALRKELKYMAAFEATAFADWLHLQLYCPAAKKRGEDVHPERISALENVPVVWHAPTPAAWRSKQQRVTFMQWALLPFTTHWLGEKTPKKTFIESTLLALLIVWLITAAISYISNPDNYSGGWEVLRLSTLLLVVALSGVWIWWGVGVMRFALRHLHKGVGIASTFTVFIVGMSLMLYATASAIENAHEWAMGLFDPVDVAEVHLDPKTNHIVLKGGVGFGTYRRLQQVISENPRASMLELNSHGGYVIEGLAMARLVKQSRLETVTFRYCDSACTLLLAAGTQRYLGPKASVGFHRSSVFGKPVGDDWTDTEFRMARYLGGQGVSDEFIQLAFSYAGDQLWLPTHGHMLDARYATGLWQEGSGAIK